MIQILPSPRYVRDYVWVKNPFYIVLCIARHAQNSDAEKYGWKLSHKEHEQ